ncbi:glycerol dehydrogenase [Vibrio cortegadensis]|uniref:glycerol dehydrogenase n=1 Tax=Vibrio cortegadensis TaxID=1328770 RepID=UPI0021C3C699|nr:glycerol dehydrogenase [Vibrio cortegadensis]MDN3697503.1 glycerol dehydrogenase [Vibrio cortegadensis]
MNKSIIAPGRYVQEANAMKKLGEYIKPLGKKALVIADDFVTGLVSDSVISSCVNADVTVKFDEFQRECSREEIERVMAVAEEMGAEVIVGIGGGKTFDTAKATGFYNNIPVVICPTIASTDSPTSSLVVIYTPEHEFSEYLIVPTNPTAVVMDTAIIAQAPTRLLVAGMGDALATYFEARANAKSGNVAMSDGLPTLAAQALAKLCYETLLADGLKAKVSCDQNLNSIALENIIEANTYLSGIGFESGGLAAAHAVHNGLTKLEECHHLYHGEKVAFGTLTQLVLENAPMSEIQEVINFCRSVGLPTNLGDMGVKEINMDKMLEVATASCAEGETMHNMPFPVTAEAVLAAMLTADKLGQ